MDVEGQIKTQADNWVWDSGTSLWAKMAQPIQDGESVYLIDPSGNEIDSHASGDGGYHLGVNAVISGNENADRHAWLSALGDQMISPRYRLVGKSFSGSTQDTNFWKEDGTVNDGTVTQSGGEIELSTSVTADGVAQYETVHNARFVAGYPNMFTGACNWVTAGTTSNVRRIGAYDDNNGFFFELNGATFSVGARKATVDTIASSGSFNGNLGTTWVPTADTYYKVDVEILPVGAFYYVNNVLLHKKGTAAQADTFTLPVRIEDTNSNGITTDVLFKSVGALVSRQGQLATESIYYHIAGDAATHVLKYGAGTLHKITYNNTSGTSLTIYDNTSAAAPVIGIITTAQAAIGGWAYDVPFSTGLTLVTAGNSLDATIVYE